MEEKKFFIWRLKNEIFLLSVDFFRNLEKKKEKHLHLTGNVGVPPSRSMLVP